MTDDLLLDEGPVPSCRMLRNESALIIAVDEEVIEVRGWRPEQLIGMASTGFIHPADQASAVAAWVEMVATPRSTRTWRGRYRAADGRWRWVETVNSNQLDDPENPVVLSVMMRITVNQMSIHEQLRAGEQLLSQLTDALPVGVFQIDHERCVTSSNNRLQEILGVAPAGTVAAQFAAVVDDDRVLLDSALSAALADQTVNDLELRFHAPAAQDDLAAVRVCQVSLRPLSDVAGTVTGAVGCLSDVTDSVELRRELQMRAAVDGLTGCLNRTATFELLDLALRKAMVGATGLAVIFVGLDLFKDLNDRFGHAAGDRALVAAADKIRQAVREYDSVGRVGGDEFLVICPEMPTAEAALPVARCVNNALRKLVVFADGQVELGASVGVAWTNQASVSPDALVARADRAMYESKRAGTGSVEVAA